MLASRPGFEIARICEKAGIVLAPGESRSFDVALPDNLTRWRAVAWSGDTDDGFEQTDAALVEMYRLPSGPNLMQPPL